jgi:hypothetical protein
MFIDQAERKELQATLRKQDERDPNSLTAGARWQCSFHLTTSW